MIMNQRYNEPIHRRHDGSIDIDLYARRAIELQRAALREIPRYWIRNFRAGLKNWGAAQRTRLYRVF
jgi:hypothetical protein